MKIRFVVPTADIVNEERDRFLTQAMGGCWHDRGSGNPVTMFTLQGHICSKCGLFFSTATDYSTPEDFLRLYEWAKNDPGLQAFVATFRARDFMNEKRGPEKRKQFADGLYTLLSARGKDEENV
ncbi:MAG TPA: hypothetical protein DDZ40_04655 [Deltaproteobacteria bacterium]|nr:hypothetical protein [Deltaproteobacteria bacterium]